MSAELTEKQAAMVAFMRAFEAANDNMPTLQTIASHFGTSPNAAFEQVRALKKKGVIERNEQGGWRFVRPAAVEKPNQETECQ